MERNTNAVISTNKLCKSYMNGEVPQHVIKNMDIQIFYKDFTVLWGLPVQESQLYSISCQGWTVQAWGRFTLRTPTLLNIQKGS